MHSLIGSLEVARVTGGKAVLDCDTPDDVARAERALLGR
jgi:CTP:molybdopterin cytidylyltransferase MocA